MPSTPSRLGDDVAPFNFQFLEDPDSAPSAMDRVALNRSLLQDAAQRQQRFVQDSLLSNQPLQQQRLALAQAAGAQQVSAARASADVAVTDSTYQAAHDDAAWREQNAADLASARADLPGVLDAINTETDPFRLRDPAITFHGRYSHLTQDPVLGEQYKALDRRVAARLQARDDEFRARISTAAAGFRPLIDPAAPDQLSAIRSDPRYLLARLDPTFTQQFDTAIQQSAALALHATREPAAPAAESLTPTSTAPIAADDARALQVDGYEGQAPTPENAQWFSRLAAATKRVEDDAGRLLNLAGTPNSSLSPLELKNAQSRAARLQATLAQNPFVPDVVSDADRQLVDDLAANPARLLDPGSSEALRNFVGRLQANRDLNADSLGLMRRPAPAPAQVASIASGATSAPNLPRAETAPATRTKGHIGNTNAISLGLKAALPSLDQEILVPPEHKADAQLSDASYDRPYIANPPDYKTINPSSIPGLDAGMFNDPKSGFSATLFYNTKTGKYVVSFRGTETSSFSAARKDLTTDTLQAFGLSEEQYNRAVKLAKAVDAAVGKDGLSFTGHSLGGGLASIAALATGRHAVTFNAAGVHANTLKRNGITDDMLDKADYLITAYSVKGEVVSSLQDNNPLAPNSWLHHALGIRVPRSKPGPEAVGFRIALDQKPPGSPLAEHGMDHVMPAMGFPVPR